MNRTSSSGRVVVVGGGISGMVAAFELQNLVRTHGINTRIDLFEAAIHLGGKIATRRIDGFVVEDGPDTFLTTKPAGLALCRELGLEPDLVTTRPDTRQSYLAIDGVLKPLPEGMSGLVPRAGHGLLRTAFLSKRARLRACFEPFVRGRSNGRDESVFEFASRRYGTEVAESIVVPLLSGIYAGDGKKMSAAAAVPQLYQLEKEFGSVSRGLRTRGNVTRQTRLDPPFASLRDGMESLIAGLRDHLGGVHVQTDTAVRSVETCDGAFLVHTDRESVRADAVVLATPAYHAADIVGAGLVALAEELRAIRFVSTALVTMGFTPAPARAPRHGYGYIVPSSQHSPVTACSWTTLKLPDRAAEGSFLLRLFMGRDGAEAVVNEPDDRLLALGRDEIRRTMGIEQEPSLVRIRRHERAMPQYTVGHLDRLARIDGILARNRGLVLAGCSYRGVGIPDCITSGKSAASAAVRVLKETVR